jgi:hypothetical protein
LRLFKRLFHFFHGSQVSDVAGNMHRGSAKAADRIRDVEVHFPGIRLGGDVVRLWKPSLFAEDLVELVDLRSIIMEYFEERRLS